MDTLEVSKRSLDLISIYRENPVIAAQDLLNIELALPQQAVLHDFWENKFTILTAGRGTGKSFMLSCFACLKALLYPGTRIGLLAPSFRQSKLVFSEVQKVWYASPILREATVSKPTFQSDRCVLNFRSVGTTPQSLIEADHLGTGEKIRGARFHVILVDEFAQVPPEIFDAVIKPMAATSSSPMERVKQVKKLKELKSLGATEEDLEGQLRSNSIVMTSSAFYMFNHMYQRKVEYERFIAAGKKGYATRTITFKDMPEGFMNEDVLEEARQTMPSSLFRMEYLAIWESDSDGVFKASLIEKCRLELGNTVKLKGEPEKNYVVACDPAKTTDFFSIVVFELGEVNKVVNAMQFQNLRFPKMADKLMEVCASYNVVRLIMDSQGGGHAIKDLLCDQTRYGTSIIIDIDDEEFLGVEGRRFLQLINPTPTVNAEVNWAAINLLEQGRLKFPGPPISVGEVHEKEEKVYETVQVMIRQMLTIVATQTKTGNVHFDVPDSGGGHGKQKKDLYSAFIYGAKKVYDLQKETEDDGPVIWSHGVIHSRDTSTTESSGGRPTYIPSSATL